MPEDRRTKQDVTPGEDPREIDRERLSSDVLDEIAGQEAIVHPQPRKGGMGTSADAPGRDLDDLDGAYEPKRLRDEA
jgi:hypothetical protein